MRSKTLIILALVNILIFLPRFSYSQDKPTVEKELILKEAQESKKGAVAVEAYLIDDILELTIIAIMYAEKPKIYNALIVGPRLGRISPKERETLYPKAEDEELFFKTTELEGGLVRLSERTKEKKLKGTLTKEFCKFKIPLDKIMPNRRYQLWIQIQSMQRSAQPEKFKFNLKKLTELIAQ